MNQPHVKTKRPLRALQVEVTSRCTRSCAVCPRTALKNVWREGDLDGALWSSLAPDLPLAEHVHFQGWGEPLLHPALPGWISAARDAGCTVGVTTNGELLGESAPWLLEAGVNVLTVSVAGSGPTHSDLRDGSRLEDVLNAAGSLTALARRDGRRSGGSGGITIQASYLLTHRNASELPDLVERAARAGIDEVLVTHLDCRPSSGYGEMSAFDHKGLREDTAPFLARAEEAAKREGIAYRGPATEPGKLLTCSHNPLRFAFIAWDGRVGPCANMLLPVQGAVRRWSGEGERIADPVVYGRLNEIRLADLLDSGVRQRFIANFWKRLAAEQRFLSSFDLAPGAHVMKQFEEADAIRSEALAASPFPDSCAACPKEMGW